MKKRSKLDFKLINFIFQTEKIKHVYRLYEHIITNPILITALVFIVIFILIVGLTLYWGYYTNRFRENILVEAHGVLFDIFILGVVIFWLQQKGRSKVEKKRYQDEIDDFRGWNSEEAARRIRGNIRRLNGYNVTSIDINNCFLRNMDLRNTDLSNCYAWGADLSWTDLRYSKLIKGNFEDANLSFSNLSGTDMKEAYFWKANMSNCNFRNSNLSNCIMLETDLSDSDFTDSNLNNTSFVNSNLKNSIFWGADLNNVDFDSADLDNADFQNADLSGAIGIKSEKLFNAFSLYKSIIPENIRKEVFKKRPDLFDSPKNETDFDF